MNQKTFHELGGREILMRVSKVFYDKVYAHPWIGKYFADVPQDVIEIQQVDFLQGALGGEKVYCGKLPVPAHKHMFINDELYQLRTNLLVESLKECGACQELIDRLIKIDDAFKSGIVKKSVADCEKRFNSDTILDFPNPEGKKAA
jgi:truncated hemoglobin YjbI